MTSLWVEPTLPLALASVSARHGPNPRGRVGARSGIGGEIPSRLKAPGRSAHPVQGTFKRRPRRSYAHVDFAALPVDRRPRYGKWSVRAAPTPGVPPSRYPPVLAALRLLRSIADLAAAPSVPELVISWSTLAASACGLGDDQAATANHVTPHAEVKCRGAQRTGGRVVRAVAQSLLAFLTRRSASPTLTIATPARRATPVPSGA